MARTAATETFQSGWPDPKFAFAYSGPAPAHRFRMTLGCSLKKPSILLQICAVLLLKPRLRNLIAQVSLCHHVVKTLVCGSFSADEAKIEPLSREERRLQMKIALKTHMRTKRTCTVVACRLLILYHRPSRCKFLSHWRLAEN